MRGTTAPSRLSVCHDTAENLQHLHIEATLHNQTLWATCSDEEIGAMHAALLASVPYQQAAVVLHWMAPALSHSEMTAVQAGMQAGMPSEGFRDVLAHVRSRLNDHRWVKLARALRLPQTAPIAQMT